MKFNVKEKISKTGSLTLSYNGELTIYSVHDFKKSLIDALGRVNEVIVDLSKVTEIDSAGFQLLLLAKKVAEGNNKKFYCSACSEKVNDILSLYGEKMTG